MCFKRRRCGSGAENIVAKRGQPMTIKTNNGNEIISKVIDKWNYERGIALDFSRLGKPTDNAMV
jgi:putative transposase